MSQLSALTKLRDAGIISRGLVSLPTVCSVSLANNGTHVSLGSSRLAEQLAHGNARMGNHDEKYLGDLAVKIFEHFLPLFGGSYSAAPYRIPFEDFHPEKVLAFLPHELDYTHLRMVWRRWKKKADLKVFGHPLTPFGPRTLDKLLAFVFRLKGDFVPDYRLIDYLALALVVLKKKEAQGEDVGNESRNSA
jgi:hypothetical protein